MSAIENPFELTVGDDGRIEVRVSQEVVAFTREEYDLIRAEFERLKDENTNLRKALVEADECIFDYIYECPVRSAMHEVDAEVDDA